MANVDWERCRQMFPVFEHWTHLNTAAFGPMPSTAVEAMTSHFRNRNLTAGQDFQEWFDRLDGIRAKIGRLIGCGPEDIGFCPNAGTALSWLLNGIPWREGDEVLAMAHEFPNNLYAPMLLDSKGVRFRPLDPPGGALAPEAILDQVTNRTRLVVLSSVNYSDGVRAPLDDIAPELRRRGVLLCIDGTQSVGVLRHDLRSTPVDFLLVHGYKWMLGPAGSGFFYAPDSTREWLRPTVVSWRSHYAWRDHESLHHGRPELPKSTQMYEGGVQPFSVLFGLEASLDLILECGPEPIESRALHLADQCRDMLRGHGAVAADLTGAARSSIVSARIPGRDTVALRKSLDQRRVAVSAREGNLRVALHFFNNADDLERLSEGVAD